MFSGLLQGLPKKGDPRKGWRVWSLGQEGEMAIVTFSFSCQSTIRAETTDKQLFLRRLLIN